VTAADDDGIEGSLPLARLVHSRPPQRFRDGSSDSLSAASLPRRRALRALARCRSPASFTRRSCPRRRSRTRCRRT
jgi:hypothetical protein